MKALFVDGPAEGQIREYPYDTTSIAVRVEVKPLDPVDIVLGDGQLPPGGNATFKAIQYVKFATDHAGRSLFKVNQ